MMHQDSLEPVAIQFTLERLQESSRRSGYYLIVITMSIICDQISKNQSQYHISCFNIYTQNNGMGTSNRLLTVAKICSSQLKLPEINVKYFQIFVAA